MMAEKSPERLALETRANDLGVKAPGNIGDKKLAARIKAREAEIAAQDTKPVMGASGAAADDGREQQAGAKVAP
ncbi:MAG: hypothetical protein COC12_14095, partial [Rhodobacteraceae bacterium]